MSETPQEWNKTTVIFMKIELNYGHETRTVNIIGSDVDVLKPAEIEPLQNVESSLNEALDNPLGTDSLEAMVATIRPSTVAIAIPDETRPTPVGSILPALITRILRSPDSARPTRITVMVGAGLHDPMPEERLKKFIPDSVTKMCDIYVHDASRMRAVSYGSTSRSTPILIAEKFAQADLKIVVGQIDPHQFVGFTGGAKGAVIGLGARETIEANHALMFHENSVVGKLEGNPVREDLNEAGRMLGLHFAVNVILDSSKRVVGLFAGDPEKVLSEGSKTCSRVYGITIKKKYDIAVASCGGYPKDICLYQAQKGLNLASQCLNPGGKIILLAKCDQGIGDDIYLNYVSQFENPEQALKDFKKLGFKMGAHKAYLFARTQVNYDVVVVSELEDKLLNQCLLKSADPDSILQKWISGSEKCPRVAIIPYANTTFFICEDSQQI